VKGRDFSNPILVVVGAGQVDLFAQDIPFRPGC
jgi:hypothetical protein